MRHCKEPLGSSPEQYAIAIKAEIAKWAIALAKTRKLKYANAGNGGSPHLAAESFKAAAEIDLEGVLYEGGVPSVKDLMLGKVDLFFASLPSVMPHLNEQRENP